MSDNERYPELLSAYELASITRKVSLLDYCHRFGVDYYKFLSWYRIYKKHLSEEVSDSGVHLTPIHVSDSPSKKSGFSSSNLACSAGSDIISFRLKLRNGIEISKQDTTLDTIVSLLKKLRTLC